MKSQKLLCQLKSILSSKLLNNCTYGNAICCSSQLRLCHNKGDNDNLFDGNKLQWLEKKPYENAPYERRKNFKTNFDDDSSPRLRGGNNFQRQYDNYDDDDAFPRYRGGNNFKRQYDNYDDDDAPLRYRGGNSFQRQSDDYNSPPRYNRNSSFQNTHQRSRDSSRYNNSFDELSKPDWQSLQPFEKNFYVPSDKMRNMTEEEIDNYRKEQEMVVEGNDIPAPMQDFSDYDFPPKIANIFSKNNFTAPTSIQAQGWPIALSGRDMVGIGETGSGKTLGFVLPALIHINNQPRVEYGDGPIALILAPTRELAQQIHSVTVKASVSMNCNPVCVFGGASKNIQASMLKNAPSICIATPGRLLDFLRMGITNLKRCSFLVMDEADRMLDMGFEPQIRQIVNQARPDRQTLMWSATWPREVRNLASDFLNDQIRLTIGSTELAANPNVEQIIQICTNGYKKMDNLLDIVTSETAVPSAKILIFCSTKRTVDSVVNFFNRQSKIRASGIHGDYSQSQRDRAINDFRKGRCTVLVATSVAARGLDISDISTVINFDFPRDIEEYVHKIGRTGRAGRSGKSISLMSYDDSSMVQPLIKILRKANQPIPEELMELESSSSYRRNPRKRRY